MGWIVNWLRPQSRSGRAEIKALKVENATLRNRLETTRAELVKATEEARYACDQRNELERALVDMTEERDMADAYIRTLEARG